MSYFSSVFRDVLQSCKVRRIIYYFRIPRVSCCWRDVINRVEENLDCSKFQISFIVVFVIAIAMRSCGRSCYLIEKHSKIFCFKVVVFPSLPCCEPSSSILLSSFFLPLNTLLASSARNFRDSLRKFFIFTILLLSYFSQFFIRVCRCLDFVVYNMENSQHRKLQNFHNFSLCSSLLLLHL